jgi:hypothetical protein
VSDELEQFRGRVDDRILDDERLPLEMRLDIARRLTHLEVLPVEAAAEILDYLRREQEAPQSNATETANDDSVAEPPADEKLEAPEPAQSPPDDGEAEEPPEGSGVIEEAEGNGDVVTPDQLQGLGLTTAAALLEETPPEPPLSAAPGGPHPPPGMLFDHAWERTVVPADAATRDWEKIRDESSLVPLPLSDDAAQVWSRIEQAWFSHDGPHRRYEYLLRKGHMGAACHLYPSLHPEPLHQLLLALGFTEEVAYREAVRRERALNPPEVVQEVQERLQAHEDQHDAVKDSFSKAFVDAQKRKERKS